MRYFSLLFFLLAFFTGLDAQSYDLSITGVVLDKNTRQTLQGATVKLYPEEVFTTTDPAGSFSFDQLSIGRYQIEVSYVGYDTFYLAELELKAGRPAILEITLSESTTVLKEIVVKSTNDFSALRPLGTHSLSLEETLRFPATFFDPARLAGNFPGVATVNDQANALAIRGQSPNQMIWRLENLDIVNPNHTANAGTFGDRITQTSGGVNILSAQLLSNSTLFKGNFPAGYGNALSGIMDMQLRKGNNQTNQRTLQVGLIGLEAALEGPFKQDSKASYLANYRYSTVGLLTQLGVDFGGESINYQDLSFNLNFPLKNKGEINIFGVGGLSENTFEPEEDSALWELEEDIYRRSFESKMGALGLTFESPTGKNGFFQVGLSLSALEHNRRSRTTAISISDSRNADDNRNQQLLSFFLQQQWAFKNNILQIGIRTNIQRDSVDFEEGAGFFAYNEETVQLYQPFAKFSGQLSDLISYNIGLHYTHFSINSESVFEPRLDISYQLNNKHRLQLAYGLFSQMQSPLLYANVALNPRDERLNLNKAHHLALTHYWTLNRSVSVKTELFYQYFYDLPISRDVRDAFSAVNLLDGFTTRVLENNGDSRSYGIETTVQRFFTDNHYFLLSGAFYDSKYRGSDDVWRNTRFNAQYQLNAVYGKEWQKQSKKRKLKTIGMNLRGSLRGGFWESPIALQSSRISRATVYANENAFSEQLASFYRIDFRFYYRINNRKGFNSTLSLDIQNLTNAQNEAFTYYDPFTENIETKFQLGAIPIISYRIEF